MDFLNTDFFKIREKFKSIESDYNISNSALEEKTKLISNKQIFSVFFLL